jgi:nitrogen-specific signal transduction histidine kinase
MVNLVTNAAQAMGTAMGTITIELRLPGHQRYRLRHRRSQRRKLSATAARRR